MTVKDKLTQKTREDPDRFYPVDVLRKEGFERYDCTSCGTPFWTAANHETCGEPDCGDGYTFIGEQVTPETYGYAEIWDMFKTHMEDRGYQAVNRYPVAARWRDDTDFVQASIYNFQPHVVNGTVAPPANPLIVPQPALRFNDVDNVGITGRHYTTHVHIGQHAFKNPAEYDQDTYFKDLLQWFTDTMQIPRDELTIIEDAWVGGGNAGVSLEFFSHGLELANQVYMLYQVKQTGDGDVELEELDLHVLDMGMGQERCAWISQGSATSYKAVMPRTIQYLAEETGVSADSEIWEKFLPYSGLLNRDETDDITQVWDQIGEQIGVETHALKNGVLPAAAVYAIADHLRSFLFAVKDGVLPSNVGGGYNIRMVLRRCFDLAQEHGFDLDFATVLERVVADTAAQYPDVEEAMPEAVDILRHEQEKYRDTRREAAAMLENMDRHEVDEDTFLELYDSHGIPPDMVSNTLNVEPPTDFYAKVAARHDQEQEEKGGDTPQVDVSHLPQTRLAYRDDPYKTRFDATVTGTVDNHVVLEETWFYPESGGQEHDTGSITLENGETYDVTGAVLVDGRVLHETGAADHVEEGDIVTVDIDEERRTQLTQHHDATHIINGILQDMLGTHVWQAGAHKGVEKARLDITHYQALTEEELDVLEEKANTAVDLDVPIHAADMSRREAEARYGFGLYQGGYVPGETLRVVEIEGVDVEACGGTHYRNTGETGRIIILRSTKVQDGVVRIEFKAGQAADDYLQWRTKILNQLQEKISFDSLDALTDVFNVSVEELVNVVDRFIEEWHEQEETIRELDEEWEERERPEHAEDLFESWKQQQKTVERLKKRYVDDVVEEIRGHNPGEEAVVTVPFNDLGLLLQAVNQVDGERTVVVCGPDMCAATTQGKDAAALLEERCEKVETAGGNVAKGFVCTPP